MSGGIRASVAAAVLVLSFVLTAARADAAPLSDAEVGALAEQAVFGRSGDRDAALKALVARGKRDIVPSLILATRYTRNDRALLGALEALTGEKIASWHEAMLWQEAHPEVAPHPSYRELKLGIFERIDPRFLRFLGEERGRPENMRIRLEEITWGGVAVDGIPSLDNPPLLAADEAGYLLDDDLVFGVEINGDARAYPLRIMGWHEMFNEVIGGVPVALAYCTLCGAGILFETQVPGRAQPFVFGSSGFLYRSNKLMFDRETDSLWNQFTGEPVTGPLADSGIALKVRPVAITTWAKWRQRHPGTRVLSLETGFSRDYGSGVVYRDYFASPDLMFPAIVRDEERLVRKDYVFGVRDVGVARAWPLEAFRERTLINDRIGERNIVLIGDAETRTVRAYERGGVSFAEGDAPDRLESPEGTWSIEEEALVGPGGARLARIPGHVSYWFAWDGYFGVESTLYASKDDG